MSVIRSFIALELPEAIIAALGTVRKGLKSQGLNIRWVNPEYLHLTLKFLGDIHPEQVDTIAGVLARTVSGKAPVSLTAKGAGVFPNIRRPNVFWIGLAGQLDSLVLLQQELDQGLGEIGFAMENRPFKGHLTVGRFKGPTDTGRLIQAIRSLVDFQSPLFEGEAVTLFQSELQPSGAVYTRLATFHLMRLS